MANQLQLQRQIEEEMEREAKIDSLINSQMKKFFKHYKQFKIVKERKDCDSIIYFKRQYPITTCFVNDNKTLDIPFDESYTYFFLKNKNPHDKKQNNRGFIKNQADDKNIHY